MRLLVDAAGSPRKVPIGVRAESCRDFGAAGDVDELRAPVATGASRALPPEDVGLAVHGQAFGFVRATWLAGRADSQSIAWMVR